MKRLPLILSVVLLLAGNLFAVPTIWPITRDTMFIPVYDSFDFSEFANRFTSDKEAAYQLMNPTNLIITTTASRSGDDDQGALNTRDSQLALPLAGAVANRNIQVWMQDFCSGNHVPPPFNSTGSNYTYTNMVYRLQWPVWTYNKDGNWTNDWPFPTNLIGHVVYSDAGYYQTATADSASGVYLHSLGGSNAALNASWQFIDSYHNNIIIITNGYPANSNYWYSSTLTSIDDHPGTVIQAERGIRDLISEGMPTNAWTWIQDWNSTSASSTNFCAAVGLSHTTTNFSASGFRPDRLTMPLEVPDGNHTNDVRDAFTMDTTLSNALFMVVRFTNAPNGIHVLSMNGIPVATNTAVNGDVSHNLFHAYGGPIHEQQMSVLDGSRRMRDVSTNDASTDQPFNNMITEFGSQSATGYPTNKGVAAYTTVMQPYEAKLELLATTNKLNSQPQTFTLTDTLVAPKSSMTVTNGAVGNLTISQSGSPTLLPPQFSVTWKTVADPLVTAYNVYYGASSRCYNHVLKVGATTSATITNVELGQKYFCSVTALHDDGDEGDFSDEASIVVPQIAELSFGFRAPVANQFLQCGPDLVNWAAVTNYATRTNAGTVFWQVPLNRSRPFAFYRAAGSPTQ